MFAPTGAFAAGGETVRHAALAATLEETHGAWRQIFGAYAFEPADLDDAWLVVAAATLKELGRFVTAAWSSSALNYGAFILILFVLPVAGPFGALVAATALSTIFSYVAMRYGVFRGNRPYRRTVP